MSWEKPTIVNEVDEYSFLYGKRFFKYQYSYSFLIGISHYKNKKHNTTNYNWDKTSFYGIPIEINYKLIKRKKRKLRFLGLFPFGEPTTFGLSTGIKIYANISNQSYIGWGVTFGFGNYKNYN